MKNYLPIDAIDFDELISTKFKKDLFFSFRFSRHVTITKKYLVGIRNSIFSYEFDSDDSKAAKLAIRYLDWEFFL